jgi:hypothetical protein
MQNYNSFLISLIKTHLGMNFHFVSIVEDVYFVDIQKCVS